MAKKLITCFLIMFVFLMVGCGAYVMKSPVSGFIYTNLKANDTVTSHVRTDKTGTAQCISILGWVATGDCSISAAMKNGGITKIHHVDFNAKSILMVYAEYTTIVVGE
ncbi:MAG: TRL-like family protein [Syntrophales bacterium]|jgi:hypothetical protein